MLSQNSNLLPIHRQIKDLRLLCMPHHNITFADGPSIAILLLTCLSSLTISHHSIHSIAKKKKKNLRQIVKERKISRNNESQMCVHNGWACDLFRKGKESVVKKWIEARERERVNLLIPPIYSYIQFFMIQIKTYIANIWTPSNHNLE